MLVVIHERDNAPQRVDVIPVPPLSTVTVFMDDVVLDTPLELKVKAIDLMVVGNNREGRVSGPTEMRFKRITEFNPKLEIPGPTEEDHHRALGLKFRVPPHTSTAGYRITRLRHEY